MDTTDMAFIKSIGPSKRLGQNFLMNRDVSKSEANFGIDRNVLEIGPGIGVLTQELCKSAKSVIAVEKDTRLFDELTRRITSKKLTLFNDDFFDVEEKKLKGADIMIANIPYSISSKVLFWLAEHQMPAVLCLQKEFVNHMVAKPSSREYSKLSVVCSLRFDVKKIFDVPRNNFYPQPNVDSALVYVKPNNVKMPKKVLNMLSLIMMHKKKKIRNAIVDSCDALGITKEQARTLADSLDGTDERPVHMAPDKIYKISKEIVESLKSV